ncbi:phosphate propanoyltransferase [Elusimicrobiota bacterium]
MDTSKIIGEVLLRLNRSNRPVVCNVSDRHVHLSKENIHKLFGTGYSLTKLRDLMQPGEFAAKETVNIVGPRNTVTDVRVLGPERSYSQVEVSRTDCYVLGIETEVRESGNIQGTAGIRIVGHNGSVWLNEGLIVARRHIHMKPEDAVFYKVKNGQSVRIRIKSNRPVIFDNVQVRVGSGYNLECHIDRDEANACDMKSGDMVFLC